MAKVITFSTRFPAWHPRAGERTYFPEKILLGLPQYAGLPRQQFINLPVFRKYDCAIGLLDSFAPKYHTIRAGNRWKVGDKASLRIWTGRPYASKQAKIVEEDVEVAKVFDITIKKLFDITFVHINGQQVTDVRQLALNDGLTLPDMLAWLEPGLPFTGQILCFNPIVNY
jgi:hypothetical protein